jgi:hypothetical protein
VTNAKILSMAYSKLTGVPTSFAGKISTTTVDSNLNMGNYTVTSNISAVNSNQFTTKAYVDSDYSGDEPSPPIKGSLAAMFSTWDENNIIATNTKYAADWIKQAGYLSAFWTSSLDNIYRPKYVDNIMSGHKILYFTRDTTSALDFSNGLSCGEMLNPNLYFKTMTVFMVIIPTLTGVGSGLQTFFSFDLAGGSSYGRCFMLSDNRDSTLGTTTWGPACYIGNGVRRFRSPTTGQPMTFTVGRLYLVQVTYRYNNSYSGLDRQHVVDAYVDGQVVINGIICSNQSSTNYGSLGCKNYASLSTSNLTDAMDCYVAEVAFFDRRFNTNERQLIESYYKRKWNLPFSYTG